MLDDVDATLVPAGFEEFVSLYKTSANARDKKRRAEFLLQPIAFPESWVCVRQLLGIEQPLATLTFGELVSLVRVFFRSIFELDAEISVRFLQVENNSLNVASEYCLDMISSTTSTQRVPMFPIPTTSIISFGDASSAIETSVRRTTGYLCLGDACALLQARGVIVKSSSGAQLSFAQAVATPDLFLPSKYNQHLCY